MPLRSDIKKVLVIGSGPIIIGQAAEFDYAGTQACRALKQEGLEVVLINSNPATIMTDKAMADKVYIEPLTLDVVKRIIQIEKPDSLLSTMGGQTGLTLSMQLAEEGFLEAHGVKLLGADPLTIHKAEDRQAFKDTMEKINQPCIPSKVVETIEDAVDFAKTIGYPVIVRPAFTLGGTGGGIADNEEMLRDITKNGLRLSPITQVLIEKCISGWKEIEFEVIRDRKGNVITVCSMENFDPVGVHTGDSIVIAPTVTLTDREYQMLRTAAINIISELKVEGGCNCQFALHPTSMEYAVIEVNPRVSRSSALASKATGYPIAKVAARIAIGYTLDEIVNQVTGKTYACFEPALDYVVVKYPKWAFDKFVYAKRTLGTQMKATGEVMAIGTSFEEAIMKAVRSTELGVDSMNMKKYEKMSLDEIMERLQVVDDERAFQLYEAMKRGKTVEELHELTMVDCWFLNKLMNLIELEREMAAKPLTEDLYLLAKQYGYLDATIERISGQKCPMHRHAVYKMVDTCAGEFKAETPYFYSTYDDENEAEEFIERQHSDKKKIIVFGSGPIRIGQGIEFDYCSVHCVWTLKEMGCEAIICNNNPETVSTDFDTGDRLYFDPLTKEDVANIINTEKPYGVVVQFGGQTAIKLTRYLADMGVNILGTSADDIDAAEDRERFDELLGRCGIPRPAGETVMTTEEALKAANDLGYPVLMRPSYVLGGQNMIIAHSDKDIEEYMAIITSHMIENPVLIDKYMMGTEVEVDAICDGEDILIPGVMEHIERAGVHSGDSISVYPAYSLSQKIIDTIEDYTRKLAMSLHVKGMINIQFIVCDGKVYVIEVNPRSSRTVPYISKVTGIPIVKLATKCIIGHKIKELGYKPGLQPKADYYAIKMPVFSFEKIRGAETSLGPEMKSTGECLGIAKTFNEALYKAFLGAGVVLPKHKKIIISVKDADKQEVVPLAQRFEKLGYEVYATRTTAEVLRENGVNAIKVNKIHQEAPTVMDLLLEHKIDIVIDTPTQGRDKSRDGFLIRRTSIETGVNCFTSLDTVDALLTSLESDAKENLTLVDIATL